MDGGNNGPKLLIAADVCHKFMACDAFAPSADSGGSSGSSQSEAKDASKAAKKDDSTSELMLDEAVKLFEKWDSSNDNVEELQDITKSIVSLAESTQDRMVCDDFTKVQNNFRTLMNKGNSKGNQKLCFACVKMATVIVRRSLEVDENNKLPTMFEVMNEAEKSICEEHLWTKTVDELKEAMNSCKGGSDKKTLFIELLEKDTSALMKDGPSDHAKGYIQKLNTPLSCPALVPYFDTDGTGSKRVTSKDIAGYINQLECAREKTHGNPDKMYDIKICNKFVKHVS